ncbi:hypothetical protein QQ045_018176 [Rhodiola kirilowii]
MATSGSSEAAAQNASGPSSAGPQRIRGRWPRVTWKQLVDTVLGALLFHRYQILLCQQLQMDIQKQFLILLRRQEEQRDMHQFLILLWQQEQRDMLHQVLKSATVVAPGLHSSTYCLHLCFFSYTSQIIWDSNYLEEGLRIVQLQTLFQ